MKFQILTFIAIVSLSAVVQAEGQSHIGELYAPVKNEKIRMTGNKKFTIHEVVGDIRNTKHYESADHHDCVITWSGKSHPNLSSYIKTDDMAEFHRISQAQTKARFRSQHKLITTSSVIVEMWGHMGDVRGKIISRACDVQPGDIND